MPHDQDDYRPAAPAHEAAVRTLLHLGYTWEADQYWSPPVPAGAIPDITRAVAVTVVIDTDDARLFTENISVTTTRSRRVLREAVLENLPKTSRIIAIMDEPTVKLLFAAYDLCRDVVRRA